MNEWRANVFTIVSTLYGEAAEPAFPTMAILCVSVMLATRRKTPEEMPVVCQGEY